MLTQRYLKRILNYDKDTGLFIWKEPSAYKTKVGDLFGGVDISTGYFRGRLRGQTHLLHRLAFLYVTGEFPAQVDHIDHDKSNNKWDNLRIVNNLVNSQNQKMRSTNKSGFNGVHWHKLTSKWQASIRHKGKSIYLGLHSKLDGAIEARKAANIKYNYHENHGLHI